jgi:hypothetical protein
MPARRVAGAAMLCLLLAGRAAQADEALPLFQNDEVLKAVLTAPIAQVYAQKNQEVRLYHPGMWSYIDGDGNTHKLDVSIRTRGHFRRDYCDLPPLQLNFKKSQVKGTLFKGQDKLKLVAPCDHGARYQQYVILEYLAYKTFEIITDYSFKTRLMRLSYVDSEEKMAPWTDMVFVIEDDSDMARRLDLDRLRLSAVEFDELDHPRTSLVQMFQFLIANNDYSVIRGGEGQCCHNTQILGLRDDRRGRIPVPFDFDMSGLVNAAYAAPPTQVPVRDVRQRYFYGLCQADDVLEAAIDHMQSKRDQIRSLFANSEQLDKKNKIKSLEYIDSFYAILDSDRRVRMEIVSRCRGRSHLERMLAAEAESKDPT